jgi:LysR family glycine cleavage system transcriptional activator
LIEGFDTLGDAVRQLRASHGPRDLSICSLPSIAQLWLSPRLPRLRKAFPNLQVSVSAEEEPPSFQRDMYDLALFYVARAKADVIAIPLAEDALFPVCSPELIADEPPRFSLAGRAAPSNLDLAPDLDHPLARQFERVADPLRVAAHRRE